MRSIRTKLRSQIPRTAHSTFIRTNSLALAARQNRLCTSLFRSSPLPLACPNLHSLFVAPPSCGTEGPLPPDAISCLGAFRTPVGRNPRAHHPDYFFSRGSGRKSAAITGEYCLSCAEFVPTSSCDRAVVHPVSCPIGWVTRPERNCGASLVGTLSPGVAPGHPVARSIRHYH